MQRKRKHRWYLWQRRKCPILTSIHSHLLSHQRSDWERHFLKVAFLSWGVTVSVAAFSRQHHRHIMLKVLFHSWLHHEISLAPFVVTLNVCSIISGDSFCLILSNFSSRLTSAQKIQSLSNWFVFKVQSISQMFTTFWSLRLWISNKHTSVRIFGRSPANCIYVARVFDFFWCHQLLDLIKHRQPDKSHVFIFRFRPSSFSGHDILDFVSLTSDLFIPPLPLPSHLFLLGMKISVHNFDITSIWVVQFFNDFSFLIAEVLHEKSYVLLRLISL